MPVTQPGIGGAPEDVIGMQVERVTAGHVVGEHRFMDVHRALWPAGGAAGEVQQCEVLRAGGGEARLGTGSRHRLMEVDRAFDPWALPRSISRTCCNPGSSWRQSATLRR